MRFTALISSFVFTSLLIVSSLSKAEEGVPESSVDGLQLIKDSNLALVYAEPGADLGRYNRIYLDDAYIAFKERWQRNKNLNAPDKISDDDMTKMKAELAALFREVFSRTLEEGGYDLVTEYAEDVLLVKPAIINLDVTSPDIRSGAMVRSYSETAGEMTLYLELYDSVSGHLIAKALDRQEDRQTGYFQWQNRVTNRAAANRILQIWANVLKEGLDEARSVVGNAP